MRESTGEPIAFAGFITEEGYPITVANRNGEFRLCASELKGKKLQVAVPGFEAMTLDLANWPEGRRQVLSLKEAPEFEPDDFEKMPVNELMRMVFENALDSYQTDALTLNGFFRELHWLPESGELMIRQEAEVTAAFPKLKKLPPSQKLMLLNLTEGSKTQNTIKTGETALLRGYESRNDSLIALVQGSVKGTPGLPVGKYLCTDLDVIRNPVYFMGGHDLEQYHFEWQKTVNFLAEPVAVVRFSPVEGANNAWFHGTLYIDLFSHAIIRAHYVNSSYTVDAFNQSSPFPAKVMLSRSYDLGYTLWQDRWHLQFAAITTDALELKNVQTVRTFSDFVVNDIRVDGRKSPDLPKEGKMERVEIAKGPFPWSCNSYPPPEPLKAERVDAPRLESDLVIHYPANTYLSPTLTVPRKQFGQKPHLFKLTMSPLTSPVYVDAPEQPVMAILGAGNQEIPVYLERGQRTVISITTDVKGQPVFNIYERKGSNNTALISFERLKKKLLESLRNAWKTGGPDEFFKMTRILQGGLLDYLRRKQERDTLSPLLTNWMRTEATYYPAAWLYAYQLQTNPYAPLPEEWQEWLSNTEVNNQRAAFNPAYQHFVVLKLKHEALQRAFAENNLYPMEEQLDLAIEMLSDTALENVVMLLLQNNLRCAKPERELNTEKLKEVLNDSSATLLINKVWSNRKSYTFLVDIPLQDVATGEAVHEYGGEKYIPNNTLLIFWNCKCDKCRGCGLSKSVVKPVHYYRGFNPVFIAPLWFEELCEAKLNDCKLSAENHTILSVYFEYLPEFVARMPFVEMPHAVLLKPWGRVKEINFKPE